MKIGQFARRSEAYAASHIDLANGEKLNGE